jgi:hypothetical protein
LLEAKCLSVIWQRNSVGKLRKMVSLIVSRSLLPSKALFRPFVAVLFDFAGERF